MIEDGQPVSIERETFPSLVGSGLFALAQSGYWSDVGTPESYIAAHHDLLGGRIRSQLPGLLPEARWIDEGAAVSPDAILETPCHVAHGAVVAAVRWSARAAPSRRMPGSRSVPSCAAPSCRSGRAWGRAPSWTGP